MEIPDNMEIPNNIETKLISSGANDMLASVIILSGIISSLLALGQTKGNLGGEAIAMLPLFQSALF